MLAALAFGALLVPATAATADQDIAVSYSTVVDTHVSDIMTVFMSDDLNKEWSPTLESHRQIYTPAGAFAHQTYKLPWPLMPRDVLLSCERSINNREAVLTSECHSVASDAAPVRDGVVRLWLSRTAWRVEALPDDRTRLSLSLAMPLSNTEGIPKFVYSYCQKRMLKDSVAQLMAAVRRLELPPHEGFVKWRRSRAAAAAAMRRVPPRLHSSASSLLAWAGEQTPSALAAIVGVLVALLVTHALAFAALSHLGRSSSRRGRAKPARADSPVSVLPPPAAAAAPPLPAADAVALRVRSRCGR